MQAVCVVSEESSTCAEETSFPTLQALYHILTGKNIVAPAQYPAVPPYNPNGTQTENNIIHIHWQSESELSCILPGNSRRILRYYPG